MKYDVVKLPAEVLRTPTKKVGRFDAELEKLVNDMRETMHAAEGIGLAATQIGKSLKLAVLEYDPKRFNETDKNLPHIPFLAIVNPRITSYGQKIEELEEGCLSIPEVHVPVPRATEISVLAQTIKGERIRIRAKGLLARILQHEIDHLNGILIVDRTTDRKIAKQFLTNAKVKNQKSK